MLGVDTFNNGSCLTERNTDQISDIVSGWRASCKARILYILMTAAGHSNMLEESLISAGSLGSDMGRTNDTPLLW